MSPCFLILHLFRARVDLRDPLQTVLFNQPLPPRENRTHLSLKYCICGGAGDIITELFLFRFLPEVRNLKIRDRVETVQLLRITHVVRNEISKLRLGLRHGQSFISRGDSTFTFPAVSKTCPGVAILSLKFLLGMGEGERSESGREGRSSLPPFLN